MLWKSVFITINKLRDSDDAEHPSEAITPARDGGTGDRLQLRADLSLSMGVTSNELSVPQTQPIPAATGSAQRPLLREPSLTLKFSDPWVIVSKDSPLCDHRPILALLNLCHSYRGPTVAEAERSAGRLPALQTDGFLGRCETPDRQRRTIRILCTPSITLMERA